MARLILLLLLLLAPAAHAVELAPPPNLIEISPQLTTSGQPSAAWLSTLKAQGYDAVIYLAPSNVSDAVRDEPQLLAAQGVELHHLPIAFGTPKDSDYEVFATLLQRLAGERKKVLVHCQVNMRASTLVFLYRVIVDRVPPEQAYEAVSRVWAPQGPWRSLMLGQLRRHGIAFDPF
jgi:protein tyrosine phosphatase (PTP) superfamily phosphohydrolase (DUF442 family)